MSTPDGIIINEPAGEPAELARFIHSREFWLVEVPGGSGEAGSAALGKVDCHPVLVAFTSRDEAEKHGDVDTDLRQPDGTLESFQVSGSDLLAGLPEGLGVLLDPASAEKCIFFAPDLVDQIRAVGVAEDERPGAQLDGGAAEGPQGEAQAIRRHSLAVLKRQSFIVAPELPLSDPGRVLRPAPELAGRLMVLGCVFAWASAPEAVLASKHLQNCLVQNSLHGWLTEEERTILGLSREEAQARHEQSVGWRLENMWPLAWVLGFGRQPTIEASQIDMGTTGEIIFSFLDRLSGTVHDLLEK